MASKRKYSLAAQLSLSIGLVALLTVGVAALMANALIGQQFERYVMDQQAERINDIVGALEAQYSPEAGFSEPLVHAAGMYDLYNGYLIQVSDKDGKVVWDAQAHDMSLCASIMAEIAGRMRNWRSAAGGKMVSLTRELTYNGQAVGQVAVSYYGPFFFTREDMQYLQTLNWALGLTAGIALLFAGIMGVFQAMRIARPIVRTASIAGRIAKGDYAVRYEGQAGSKELDALVGSVNALAQALEEQEALRRRLTGDVAHELRTPLAAVSAHLEMMLEGVWQPTKERLTGCYDEISRLSCLVADLQELATAESGSMKLDLQKADLKELALAVGRAFEAELARKRLDYQVQGEALALGDSLRLHQVLSNLLSNAVKYTGENGHIRVLLREEGEQAVLAVSGDGVGIPQEALPLIFERFYRVDASRSRKTGGAGIGLAIVRSIVLAHGGSVEAVSDGHSGSTFVVRLPRYQG